MAHSHGGPATGRYLGVSIALTSAFVLGEALAGYFSGSLALLSDAGHNLADGLALVFSWYALRAARRPPDERRTFGYHRAGILAALVNAVSLVLLAVLIFWEAFQRLWAPPPVEAGWMIGVALAAVVVNGLISVWLHGEAQHDLNVRSAYLHMLGDAVSALGVVVAGVIVARTGYAVADPLVSVLIGVLILVSSWGILGEAAEVLMESVPRGLDLGRLTEAVRGVPGVLGVHHVHAWTLGSGLAACSLHIVVAEQGTLDSQRIGQAVARMLEHEFHLGHTTIQVEVEGCAGGDPHCVKRPECREHGH